MNQRICLSRGKSRTRVEAGPNPREFRILNFVFRGECEYILFVMAYFFAKRARKHLECHRYLPPVVATPLILLSPDAEPIGELPPPPPASDINKAEATARLVFEKSMETFYSMVVAGVDKARCLSTRTRVPASSANRQPPDRWLHRATGNRAAQAEQQVLIFCRRCERISPTCSHPRQPCR